MKLGDMADLLSGLAVSLEKFMGKAAVSDLHEMSSCLRKFSDENVKAFCAFIEKAKESKQTVTKSRGAAQEAAVAELTAKIKHCLDHLDEYDYPALRQLIGQIGKLQNASIKAIGENIGCPVSGSKPQMTARLEEWLLGIKSSAHQASYA